MQEQPLQNNLARALNQRAEKWLDQAEDLLGLKNSTVAALKAREAQPTQGYLTTAYWLERGLQKDALRRGVLECMVCGGRIQDAYRLYVLDERPVLLCAPCAQSYEEELTQRQAEITGLLKRSIEDLALICENEPDFSRAETNLGRAAKIAAQAGVLYLFPDLPSHLDEPDELSEEQKLNLLTAPPIQPTGIRARPPVGPVLLPMDDPLWPQKFRSQEGANFQEKAYGQRLEIGEVLQSDKEDWLNDQDDPFPGPEVENSLVGEENKASSRKVGKEVNLWLILFVWIVILGVFLIFIMDWK